MFEKKYCKKDLVLTVSLSFLEVMKQGILNEKYNLLLLIDALNKLRIKFSLILLKLSERKVLLRILL